MIIVRTAPARFRTMDAASLSSLVLFCSLLGAACSPGGASATPAAGGPSGRGAVPVAVVTDTVVEKPMGVNVRVVGNVEAASTVDVRAQVSGALLSVEFKEGQDVTAGQLLFTIDPRPFEIALRQAEAALARNTVQAKGADAQLARSNELLKLGLVAPSAHEATASQAAMLHASMAADAAQIENAKLQLQYTKITAPVSGRTGALLVNPGAIVRANDATPLVVINQISPVFVTFAVPARRLADIRDARTSQSRRVTAAPAGSADGVVEGRVTFIDNQVDRTTDTIRVKASFDNRQHTLWPGAFVDVTLQLSVNPKAIVVPNAAIQASQQGQAVYVVKADNTVEIRPVTTAWTEGNETVVERGLAAGETVVTDGQLRLTPGARVSTKSADQDAKEP